MKTRLPFLLSTALLTGCFGGSSTTKTTSGSTLSGIAATGAPISNGTVEIKGKNGVVVETTTDSTGSYGASVSNLESPYLIRVTSASGEKLISVASSNDVKEKKKVNVTPLTHTIVANVFEMKDPESLFTDFQNQASEFTEAKVTEQKEELQQKLEDVLIALGVTGPVDLMNGSFVAGSGAGLDKLLDALEVDLGSSANIEIKIKGNSAPIITDDVAVIGEPAPTINASEFTVMNTQLDALAGIKAFYTAAGATFATIAPCNGPAVVGGSCDKTILKERMSFFFHTNYKYDGLNKEQDSWGIFCRGTSQEATDAASCTTVDAGEVTFKDITLIKYNDSTGEAFVSVNFYMDGEYQGYDVDNLKKEGGVWKFVGNGRKYRIGVEAQSVHRSQYNLSNVLQTTQEKFGAELQVWVDPSASAFLSSSAIKITAINDNGTVNTALNTALGNASGIALEVSQGQLIVTAKKYIDMADGSLRATTCASCTLNHSAHQIQITSAALALMQTRQKFELAYNDGSVQTEHFFVTRPALVTPTNAATLMPALTSSSFCSAPGTSYGVVAPSGTSLNHGSAYFGFHDGSNYTGVHDDAEIEGNQATMTLNFGGSFPAGTLANAGFYLHSRDEYDRSFVRIIECR